MQTPKESRPTGWEPLLWDPHPQLVYFYTFLIRSRILLGISLPFLLNPLLSGWIYPTCFAFQSLGISTEHKLRYLCAPHVWVDGNSLAWRLVSTWPSLASPEKGMTIRDTEIRLVYWLVCLFVSIALVDVRRPSLGVAVDCMRVEKANRIQAALCTLCALDQLSWALIAVIITWNCELEGPLSPSTCFLLIFQQWWH